YRVLHGNVRFRKDSMYMYCDSAYFYEKNNSLDAYGNVRMEQGDTLFIYGDVLYYDGKEQLAELRNNVRMINRNVTLYTDSLNYDMVDNIGYYFAGGTIVDEKNELVSIYGEYSTATKDAEFNFDVVLTNEDYVIYSDTMRYNTDTKISYLYGPSTIVSDSNTIYTTNGWYDTNANHAMLLERSRLVGDQKMLTGDTLFYDRNNGVGEAFGNMFLIDSVQSVIMEGHYGFYNEITDYTFATDSARVMEFSRKDTLYMHADTLLSFVDADSTRILRAFHGVRFFRVNAQGVCDSLQYVERDSTLTMYTKPVLWSGEQQIFGDTIRMFFNDSTIDWAHIINNSFATQGKGGDYYDQMEGNEIKAYFVGEELHRMETLGNVLAIFYPQDNDSTLTGMLNTEASFLNIFLENNEMKKMVMWPSVKGKMYPIEELSPANMFLSRYIWYGDRRPKDKNDIYRRQQQSTIPNEEEQRNNTTHKFNL
ncbi:MAG: hypothetical protein J6U43_00495, partial [Bacteroidales bacterium]|nr:hypothetical protein [Bacteroidales bacterium]